MRACATAETALEELEPFRPHVLLSDVEMPREDGYELIRRVRALPASRGGTVPAAAITAYGRTEDRVRALSAGFTTYLPKPVDPSELAAVVATLAARGPASPSTSDRLRARAPPDTMRGPTGSGLRLRPRPAGEAGRPRRRGRCPRDLP